MSVAAEYVVTERAGSGHVYVRAAEPSEILWRGHSFRPGTPSAIGCWSSPYALAAKHQHSCTDPYCCWFECIECKRILGACFGAADQHPDTCDECRAKKAGA